MEVLTRTLVTLHIGPLSGTGVEAHGFIRTSIPRNTTLFPPSVPDIQLQFLAGGLGVDGVGTVQSAFGFDEKVCSSYM